MTIRQQPKDGDGSVVHSIFGISAIFAAPTMDGVSFKPITLTTDSKSIKIQAGNGVADDFTSFASNPPTFHFALVANPTVWTQHVGELNFDCVAESGTVPCYIRAAIGVVISVTVGA